MKINKDSLWFECLLELVEKEMNNANGSCGITFEQVNKLIGEKARHIIEYKIKPKEKCNYEKRNCPAQFKNISKQSLWSYCKDKGMDGCLVHYSDCPNYKYNYKCWEDYTISKKFKN